MATLIQCDVEGCNTIEKVSERHLGPAVPVGWNQIHFVKKMKEKEAESTARHAVMQYALDDGRKATAAIMMPNQPQEPREFAVGIAAAICPKHAMPSIRAEVVEAAVKSTYEAYGAAIGDPVGLGLA